MSGGYFDNKENYLEYIAEQLEKDIEFNDINYDSSKPYDSLYGFQYKPKTVKTC